METKTFSIHSFSIFAQNRNYWLPKSGLGSVLILKLNERLKLRIAAGLAHSSKNQLLALWLLEIGKDEFFVHSILNNVHSYRVEQLYLEKIRYSDAYL